MAYFQEDGLAWYGAIILLIPGSVRFYKRDIFNPFISVWQPRLK